jgi:hypothetical protein
LGLSKPAYVGRSKAVQQQLSQLEYRMQQQPQTSSISAVEPERRETEG